MTDYEFLDKAEAALIAIESCCDRINDETDADIDNQRNGTMVTLIFHNQTQIIINLQKPLHEIWMAAKSGGYHYEWIDGHWKDTKSHIELFTALSINASTQSGRALNFKN